MHNEGKGEVKVGEREMGAWLGVAQRAKVVYKSVDHCDAPHCNK